MKEATISLGLQIGRRGAFLLFLALLDFVYAYGLIFPTPRSRNNPGSVFLADLLPLWVWGAIWGTVGVVCVVFAFRRSDRIGYACAMFLKVLWALVYLLGWLFADVERGYLSTAIWGAFAAVLWLLSGWKESEPLERQIDELADRNEALSGQNEGLYRRLNALEAMVTPVWVAEGERQAEGS